ncbi:hypothetical protein [Sulfuritalea sp.]|uniref:hypothetical protein n=1 Tax=Sulfuritalea sp. TaxID=2480090 RepID=UPI00286DC862|nr:hypothetical protein [Sulfuritalea sp.]
MQAANLQFDIYYIRHYAQSVSINPIWPSTDFGICDRRLRILAETDKSSRHTTQHSTPGSAEESMKFEAV